MGSTAAIAMPVGHGPHIARPRVPRALLVLAGGTIGQLVMLPEDALLLGRGHDCGLRLGSPSDGTSRRHAQIFRRGRSVRIRDLGSRNGLHLNGQRCREGLLQAGDLIGIGSSVIKVLASAEDIALYRQLDRKRQAALRALPPSSRRNPPKAPPRA